MPATWESASVDPTTATSDASISVAKPAGLAVGDLLLAFGGCTDARTISPPAGWTEVADDTDGTGRVYVWTKTADASDVAATAFAFSVSGTFNSAVVSVHRVSGASANAPTVAFGTGPNSQTQTCPTLITPSADCLVFWGAYRQTNTSSTADKGTERIDAGNAAGACWMSQYTSLEASAGSVSGATITTGAFGTKRVYSVAIESAGGGAAFIDVFGAWGVDLAASGRVDRSSDAGARSAASLSLNGRSAGDFRGFGATASAWSMRAPAIRAASFSGGMSALFDALGGGRKASGGAGGLEALLASHGASNRTSFASGKESLSFSSLPKALKDAFAGVALPLNPLTFASARSELSSSGKSAVAFALDGRGFIDVVSSAVLGSLGMALATSGRVLREKALGGEFAAALTTGGRVFRSSLVAGAPAIALSMLGGSSKESPGSTAAEVFLDSQGKPLLILESAGRDALFFSFSGVALRERRSLAAAGAGFSLSGSALREKTARGASSASLDLFGRPYRILIPEGTTAWAVRPNARTKKLLESSGPLSVLFNVLAVPSTNAPGFLDARIALVDSNIGAIFSENGAKVLIFLDDFS